MAAESVERIETAYKSEEMMTNVLAAVKYLAPNFIYKIRNPKRMRWICQFIHKFICRILMQNAIKNYIFYPLAFIDLVIKWEKYSINSSLTKEQIVEKPLE